MQLRKQMRQTLRRLKKTVETTDAATAAGAAGAAAGSSLSTLGSALKGGISNGNGAAAIAAALSADVIRGAAPPKKIKKLRHSFNSGLREHRLAEGLEDLTDDEDEQRLGLLNAEDDAEFDRPVGRPQTSVIHEDEDGEDVEEAGVKKAAHRPVPKQLNHITEATFRDGCVGLFDSDPALSKPKKEAHRKSGKKKPGRNTAAMNATTAHDFSGDAAGGAKAKYRFWQ